MKTISNTIEPEIAAVLGRASIDGTRLVLHEQLDRQTYTRVAKVIELLGGKWNRKQRAHVFDEDASELVADALMAGTVLDLRKTYQAFPTPAGLAAELVALADVDATDLVLEPSAGAGRIAAAVRGTGAELVMCEIQEVHHRQLQNFGTVIGSDFLQTPIREGVTKVVANPPFARGQDVAHVTRMAQWIATGGTLVSVMSPAWTYRTTTLHATFRDWAKAIGATWRELPPGSFAESGTNVRAGVLVAQLPRSTARPGARR